MDEITNLTYELQRINKLVIKNKEDLDYIIGLLKDANDDLYTIIKDMEKQI